MLNRFNRLGRILLLASGFLVLLGGLITMLPAEQTFSLYNRIFPGRLRLPYGENQASYNLSLNHIPAAFASHEIARPKAEDEYRIVVIGDSGVWGWFLENRFTLPSQLESHDFIPPPGKSTVEVYNLAYPILSLTKDALILDEAIQHHEPDLIIWLVTLESFAPNQQTIHPIVQNNPERVTWLGFDTTSDPFVQETWQDRTPLGRRQALANRLRLQIYGVAWAATGIDQFVPAEFELRSNDFEGESLEMWHGLDGTSPLQADDIALDLFETALGRADAIPVLIVNEPIYVSDGTNSDIRYNSLYPRWVYDQYRALLANEAALNGWHYFDAWDVIPPEEFTDSPVHLTSGGNHVLAHKLIEPIQTLIDQAGTPE